VRRRAHPPLLPLNRQHQFYNKGIGGTSSGSVSFAGSLGAGPHSLRTDFGDIVLRLPADAAATFDLGTDFGSIHSDFPVTLSGDMDATAWQGTLGGGGPRLTVHTSSGSIRLETLSA